MLRLLLNMFHYTPSVSWKSVRVNQAAISLWRQEGSFMQGDTHSRFWVAGDRAEQGQGLGNTRFKSNISYWSSYAIICYYW
jgi:hypothetical protein